MNAIVKANRQEWQRISSLAEEGRAFYHQGDGAVSRLPHTICVAVNNYCFMRCHMCDVGAAIRDKGLRDDMLFFFARQTGGGKAYFLPFETIRDLIDDVAPYRPIIRTNFLEPLIRDDIADIAEYSVSRGLQFYVQTNGYLLPKRALPLLEAGTRCIRVSIDGPKAVHDEIRGVRDSWHNAMKGLQILLDWKKRHESETPLVGLSFTLSDHNFDKIVDFYREIDELGLAEDVYVAINHLKYSSQAEADRHNGRYRDFFPMTETSLQAVDLPRIDTEVMWRQFEILDREFPKDRYKRHVNPLLDREEMRQWYDGETYLRPGTPCYEPWTVAQIHFDGEVGVNGRCVSPNFGNIKERPFTEIWNSPAAQAFRRGLRQDPDMPSCNRCSRSFRTQI